MNTPQINGIYRHVVNTLGTVLLTLAAVNVLPESIRNVATPENVEILKASLMAIIGSAGAIWAIFKSSKAPEKQISETEFSQLVSKLKDKK